MRLITKNVGGNIHQAATTINKLGLARFFVAIDCVEGRNCIVVFRIESYPDYLWFCEKWGDEPMSVQEYCS